MPDTNLSPLPCPFCGESRDVVYHSLSSCVSCTACSAEGPCAGDKHESIAAWNERPALTPKQKAAEEMYEALTAVKEANQIGSWVPAMNKVRAALTKAGQQ